MNQYIVAYASLLDNEMVILSCMAYSETEALYTVLSEQDYFSHSLEDSDFLNEVSLAYGRQDAEFFKHLASDGDIIIGAKKIS